MKKLFQRRNGNRVALVVVLTWTLAESHAVAIASEPRTLVATGVLVSDQGGLYGQATGEIRLFSEGHELRVFYEKPYPRKGFSGGDADQIGSWWKIHYHRIRPDPATAAPWKLDRAEFLRRFDEPIRDAVQTLREYYQNLQHKQLEKAYFLLSTTLRQNWSLAAFVAAHKDLAYSDFEHFGWSVTCAEVIFRDATKITLAGSPLCYSADNEVARRWREFDVVRQGDLWRIDSIRVRDKPTQETEK